MTPSTENDNYCDLWGRKINFTNSKTLVGRCRDRRDSPLAFQTKTAKMEKTKNENQIKKIFKKHQKTQQNDKIRNEKNKERKKEKRPPRERSFTTPLPGDSSKNCFFQKEMLQEIVQHLGETEKTRKNKKRKHKT